MKNQKLFQPPLNFLGLYQGLYMALARAVRLEHFKRPAAVKQTDYSHPLHSNRDTAKKKKKNGAYNRDSAAKMFKNFNTYYFNKYYLQS